jgi:hypothetical protein
LKKLEYIHNLEYYIAIKNELYYILTGRILIKYWLMEKSKT